MCDEPDDYELRATCSICQDTTGATCFQCVECDEKYMCSSCIFISAHSRLQHRVFSRKTRRDEDPPLPPSNLTAVESIFANYEKVMAMLQRMKEDDNANGNNRADPVQAAEPVKTAPPTEPNEAAVNNDK